MVKSRGKKLPREVAMNHLKGGTGVQNCNGSDKRPVRLNAGVNVKIFVQYAAISRVSEILNLSGAA